MKEGIHRASFAKRWVSAKFLANAIILAGLTIVLLLFALAILALVQIEMGPAMAQLGILYKTALAFFAVVLALVLVNWCSNEWGKRYFPEVEPDADSPRFHTSVETVSPLAVQETAPMAVEVVSAFGNQEAAASDAGIRSIYQDRGDISFTAKVAVQNRLQGSQLSND